jgi:beta-lactamase superfamily II metal-dependent hydrolase
VEGPLAEVIGEIDLIKVSHHGSKSSTSAKFLDATSPSAAIISVGDGNGFGHPDQSVISAMLDRGIEVHQTERGATLDPGVNISNGDILITASKDGSFEIFHF